MVMDDLNRMSLEKITNQCNKLMMSQLKLVGHHQRGSASLFRLSVVFLQKKITVICLGI